MFVALICITMTLNATSTKMNEGDGAMYFPIFITGMSICIAFGAGILNQIAHFNEETEDHYYVENA